MEIYCCGLLCCLSDTKPIYHDTVTPADRYSLRDSNAGADARY